ncbi:MAG: glycoside hydrolase family 32 protein, partial [Clostridia bacterium]|nr:glycoside hydrolase family 32 protein [Clostridia bacterium]
MSLASFSVEKKYVVLPVGRYVDSRKIQFSFGGNVFLEIDTRLDYVNPVNCVYADVSEFIGLQIDVEIHPGVEFVNMQTDEKDRRRYECVNRPEIHFTPSYGWLNDPNGLVKYRSPVTGETVWHMFYQFNPYDTVWGNMHWGHAVSHDLIHWEEKDIALCPDSTGTMFSGSAIVDSDNVSGLKKGKDDPILLFYTAAGGENLMSKGKVFTQCLAFSTDGGKTFSKYEKNPIISAVTPANRDPKVIYCEEMERWIMALYLDRSTYCIFTSEDLINWVKLQDINLEGDAECPDIFPLNVSGNPDDRKWVFRGASHRYLVLECRNYHFDVIQDSKPLN